MKNRRTKQAHEKAVRTTVTFNPEIWKLGQRRKADLLHSDFASYLAALIRADAGIQVHVTPRKEPSPA